MSFARTAAAVVLVYGLAWPRALPAAPRKVLPPKVDISKFRDQLLVLHDKKGHYMVVPNILDNRVHRARGMGWSVRDALFYGNGKRFFLQRCPNRSRNPPRFSLVFSDPRARRQSLSIFNYRPPENGGSFFLCDNRKTPLFELDGAQRTRILNKASFHQIYWRRQPHLLARDDDGVYFYVDRGYVPSNGRQAPSADLKDFRLWVGKRARMKRVKLNDVIVDPAGQIFITKKGKLRVENAAKKRYIWQVGDKRVVLTQVPLDNYNGGLMMLYRQLGPYLGERLERPCDDL